MKVMSTSGQIPVGNMGMSQGSDAVSREIKNQIAAAQKKMQAVSSDTKLSAEEKMKKRQEIQKEICDLQNQLRQHEIEMRREAQLGKNQSQTNGAEGAEAEKGGAQGLSQAGMEAMITADAALGQAEALSGVQTSLEGKARILKGEIKMDGAKGASTEEKEAALAELEGRAERASAAGISSLHEAIAVENEVSERDKEQQDEEMEEEEIHIISDVEERKKVNVLL